MKAKLPSASPGKLRLMSRPSIGDRRVPACAAGKCSAGMMMTRPCTAAGSSSRASSCSAICPSYSSPCTPPDNRTYALSHPIGDAIVDASEIDLQQPDIGHEVAHEDRRRLFPQRTGKIERRDAGLVGLHE